MYYKEYLSIKNNFEKFQLILWSNLPFLLSFLTISGKRICPNWKQKSKKFDLNIFIPNVLIFYIYEKCSTYIYVAFKLHINMADRATKQANFKLISKHFTKVKISKMLTSMNGTTV